MRVLYAITYYYYITPRLGHPSFSQPRDAVLGGGKLIFESFTICLEKCCKTIIYNVNHVCNIIMQKKYV